MQFIQPAAAADKIDALVAARIGDTKNRLDECIASQERERQPRHRVSPRRRPGREFRAELQTVPAVAEHHADFARARRTHRLPACPRSCSVRPICRQCFFRAASVEVAQARGCNQGWSSAACGEQRGREIRCATFAATGFRNAFGRGGAMMAVGNIKCRQGVDRRGSARRWSPVSSITQSSWRSPSSAVTSTAGGPAATRASIASMPGALG